MNKIHILQEVMSHIFCHIMYMMYFTLTLTLGVIIVNKNVISIYRSKPQLMYKGNCLVVDKVLIMVGNVIELSNCN